jgi:hypothetical protein
MFKTALKKLSITSEPDCDCGAEMDRHVEDNQLSFFSS